MGKTLDESTITNELRGASKYFSGARDEETEKVSKEEKPIDRSEHRSVKRSVYRSEKHTVPEISRSVDSDSVVTNSVLDEVRGGVIAPLRATERYAFEIFSDQKRQLNRIRFLYEEKTGKKLSASRILREAIEPHLNALEVQLTKP